jgi:hypothetical protein
LGQYHYTSSLLETGSYVISESVPRGDIYREYAKRVLNNLPYILKTKGTRDSVRAVLDCYGISPQILKIKEYGGLDPIGATYDSASWNPDTEAYDVTWPNITSNRLVSNKVRIYSGSEQVGILDSRQRVTREATQDFPIDNPKIGVYFSPTNEINEYVANYITGSGNARIDDYIGDPGNQYSSSYVLLESFRRRCLAPYISNYNGYASLRLSEFFDNSMFRLIKSVLPARSKKILGVAIEPDILMRSKVNILNAQPSAGNNVYNASIDIQNYAVVTSSYNYIESEILTYDTAVESELCSYGIYTADTTLLYIDGATDAVVDMNNILSQPSKYIWQDLAKTYVVAWDGSDPPQPIYGAIDWTRVDNSYLLREAVCPTIYDTTSLSGSIEKILLLSTIVSGSTIDQRLMSRSLSATEIDRLLSIPAGTANQRYNGCLCTRDNTPDDKDPVEWWLTDNNPIGNTVLGAKTSRQTAMEKKSADTGRSVVNPRIPIGPISQTNNQEIPPV